MMLIPWGGDDDDEDGYGQLQLAWTALSKRAKGFGWVSRCFKSIT